MSPVEGLVADALDRRRLFQEMVQHLSPPRRTLPPRLFYDARGAELFEAITRLEEYYPTRTETGILADCLPRVAELVGPGARVVEPGSGSGEKARTLLDALDRPAVFIPMDVAHQQLDRMAAGLEARYPELEVIPVAGDYTEPFHLPEASRRAGATLFFFPGSTIGNLEPPEARRFLSQLREGADGSSSLLIGVDRVKSREVLELAYDDGAGVTAAFNRNALLHLNRLLGGNFRPERFLHRAPWNARASRIEMHLVSREAQEVVLNPGLPEVEPLHLHLEEGEPIVTEHSYKYTPESFQDLTDAAGWRTVERWTDPREWFQVVYLES